MSSGFITESEILEQRRRRQEEWEKVRTEDQPKDAPEEAYDTRPLYQRLEEQKMKKDAEYEEAHKLKNMIRGLDDDEVGFLDLVEQSKAKAAQMISMEEKKEMQEFRERVSNLAESEEMTRLRAQLAPAAPRSAGTTVSQKNKLAGVVVRKRKASELEGEKDKDAPAAKSNGLDNNGVQGAAARDASPRGPAQGAAARDASPRGPAQGAAARDASPRGPAQGAAARDASPRGPAQGAAARDASPRGPAQGAAARDASPRGPAQGATLGALRCVGVLPGLGPYDSDTSDNSDTDDSSDHDTDRCCARDLLGRLPDDKRKEGDNKS